MALITVDGGKRKLTLPSHAILLDSIADKRAYDKVTKSLLGALDFGSPLDEQLRLSGTRVTQERHADVDYTCTVSVLIFRDSPARRLWMISWLPTGDASSDDTSRQTAVIGFQDSYAVELPLADLLMRDLPGLAAEHGN